MKKQFKPIAMRCNKEQFEAIKPKLDRNGNEIFMIGKFKENTYLVLFDHGEITNGSEMIRENYIIHETWNERIFLEVCGIEKEEYFEVTKETIIKYKMKDEFPEVFEKEEPLWLGFFENDCLIYGFDTDGDYFNKIHKKGATDSTNDVKATEQEVFEALKNEAVRRGFVEGAMYKNTSGEVSDLSFGWNGLHSIKGDEMIFSKGTWATIIETKNKRRS